MAFIRAFGGGGIPSALKSAMNAVLNKKFGTSTTYAPEDWPEDVNLLGPLPEKTVSGSIAHITDGADTVPIKAWNVTVDANLDGVSSIEVTQAGKNLYDVDGAEYNAEFYDASGNVVRYADCAVSWIKVNPSTKYSFLCTKETTQTVNVRIAWCKSDKSFISRQGLFSDNQFPMTLTTPNNCEWVQLSVNQYATALISQNNWSIQVEQGDTSTTFEAYTATTSTVSLGRTIYGGSADLVNGTGTDYGVKETITSTYLSGLSSSYIGYSSSVSAMNNHPCVWVRNFGYPTANEFVVGGIKCACNHFPVTMNNSQIISTQYRIYFDVDGKNISSVQDFIDYVSALENNNDSLDVVYQKSAPDDFTFTPISPTPDTALGVNNFWADTGDSEVTYRADIALALAANSSRGLMMASRSISEDEILNENTEEVENDENIRQDSTDR